MNKRCLKCTRKIRQACWIQRSNRRAGEKKSGITIHYVDEIYDNGEIIFQTTCPVEENDTPDSLAQKIHLLEHLHYPVEIEKLLK